MEKERLIAEVMKHTGMDYMQAFRHVMQRLALQRASK